MSKSFSLRHRKESFGYAFEGLGAVLRTEHNTWIHLALTIIAITLGYVLRISANEWAALILAFALVWAAELFNTVCEKLADLITTEPHPQIKVVKDMAAAAVLITALAAAIVGCIVFLPKIWALLPQFKNGYTNSDILFLPPLLPLFQSVTSGY